MKAYCLGATMGLDARPDDLVSHAACYRAHAGATNPLHG